MPLKCEEENKLGMNNRIKMISFIILKFLSYNMIDDKMNIK